jgi:hypothetical protein
MGNEGGFARSDERVGRADHRGVAYSELSNCRSSFLFFLEGFPKA